MQLFMLSSTREPLGVVAPHTTYSIFSIILLHIRQLIVGETLNVGNKTKALPKLSKYMILKDN